MRRWKQKDGRFPLSRYRRHRLKYITVLPSLVTILNGVFGFASIVLASHGKFAQAGYILLLAMIADMLDGQLARISKNTSSFGGQLDSLCDVISFGAAPAFLMLKILEHKLEPANLQLLERFIAVAATAYVCCTAIRLARFNVENIRDESVHTSFTGLPSPAGAGVIISLVIFHQDKLADIFSISSREYHILDNIIMYSLPFATLAVGALMVSRVKYQHVVNQYLSGKKPFTHLVWLIMALGIIVWNPQIALVLLFCGFAASGFIRWIYYKVTKKHEKTIVIADQQPPAPATGGGDFPSQDDNV